MYHGIINVYKEPGYTSFDVVAKLRGICGQKKIGHTGTLDPEAEGVLPVCLGRATKVCDMLTDSDKTYRAVMLLGVRTDTQDTTGTVLESADISGIAEQDIYASIASYTGEIDQIPPMYSALKVNGQKLCDLARKGITVERKARRVHIYDIQVLEVNLPRVEMRVHCSKGTYIRTLIDDIGSQLGCGAAMEHLTRERAAGYLLENALKLSEIQALKEEGRLEECIRPVEDVFEAYPPVCVKQQAEKMLYNGNALQTDSFEEQPDTESPVRVYDTAGQFCGIYQYIADKNCYKPQKMFLPESN